MARILHGARWIGDDLTGRMAATVDCATLSSEDNASCLSALSLAHFSLRLLSVVIRSESA